MGKQHFLKRASAYLDEIKIPHQISNDADISIHGKFQKQQDDDDKVIMYFATLFVNEEKNSVYAYERAMAGNLDISKKPDYGQTFVSNVDNRGESSFIIASIIEGLSLIAESEGLTFNKTDKQTSASYPPGHIPLNANIDNIDSNVNKSRKFCTNCGSKINAAARFCPECGADSNPVAVKKTVADNTHIVNDKSKQRPVTERVAVNKKLTKSKTKKKKPIALIIIIMVVVIAIFVAGGILLAKNSKSGELDKQTEQTPLSGWESGQTNSKEPFASNTPNTTDSSDSSVVSSGVQSCDLGNIMNGQYYFCTEQYIFYSSYDTNDKAHIYSLNKESKEFKSIFDGFGWSLVVIDDWLYFTGNQGELIDGSYNIFRMRFDGSQLERITEEYSYGMFLYDDYLYYMKRSLEHEDLMSVCRSSLEGKNEEVLFPRGFSPIIFENQLYYHDNQGNMFRTKPDGSKPQVLLTAMVKAYVLSGGKIIYIDYDDNIYSCDLDGKNNKLIRNSKGMPISDINAYKNRIYFAEYDINFNYAVYGYNYTIKSCKMEGSDEKPIFSSVSYGIYMNIVNDKLMCMDYIRSENSEVLSAKINIMNLDGSNLYMLER